MDLLKNVSVEFPISPIELDGADLRGVEVRREWQHIDLLITCREPRFAIVVENKVDSQEHSNQLPRYRQTMRDHYPDLPAWYVYLTPDGVDALDDSWRSYGYAAIHRVFLRVRDTYHNAIGDEVLVFLDHYLNLLGTRFMNDEKLDELCRRIYKNHRQALDLIWERVGSSESRALAEAANAMRADPRWHVCTCSNKSLDFIPKSWLEWLPKFGLEKHPHWMAIHLRVIEGKLYYIIYLGQMGDAAKRKEILVTLRKKIHDIGFKPTRARENSLAWSRITSAQNILKWVDKEPDPEAIHMAVKKNLDELYPKLGQLAMVLKPLCNLSASGT